MKILFLWLNLWYKKAKKKILVAPNGFLYKELNVFQQSQVADKEIQYQKLCPNIFITFENFFLYILPEAIGDKFSVKLSIYRYYFEVKYMFDNKMTISFKSYGIYHTAILLHQVIQSSRKVTIVNNNIFSNEIVKLEICQLAILEAETLGKKVIIISCASSDTFSFRNDSGVDYTEHHSIDHQGVIYFSKKYINKK